MQDAALILRASYAYNTVSNLGVVTPVAAAGAVTTTGNTGYFAVANTNEIPRDGGVLEFNIPGGTTTGAPTSVNIAFTIDYSDDNSTSVAQEVSKTWTLAVGAGNVVPAAFAYMRLRRSHHKYIRVTYTVSFTGGTSPTVSFTQLGIALVFQESDSYRVATDLS